MVGSMPHRVMDYYEKEVSIMLVNKNSTSISNITRSVLITMMNGYTSVSSCHLVQWLIDRLTHPRIQQAQPGETVIFELGNERYLKDGYYPISAEEAKRERAMSIQTLNLLQPRF
jgi:hypothetical protein